METPDLFDFDEPGAEAEAPARPPRPPQRAPAPQIRPGGSAVWSQGARIAWIAGLVLMLSSFMSWYAGSSPNGLPTVAVIGWHTGALGKLVFFVGLAIVALAIMREAGFELPPNIPESLVTIGLGALGTIFVLIRLISIPDTYAGISGRGIGIWIGLLAALGVIVAGLIRAGEEL